MCISITAIRSNIRLHLVIVIGHLAFIVAMVMVVMVVIGDTCGQSHTHYYQATMLVIVIKCLRLFVGVILLLPWRW